MRARGESVSVRVEGVDERNGEDKDPSGDPNRHKHEEERTCDERDDVNTI